MKIAVTSQNRRAVTAHAGRCRKFWVFNVDDGKVTGRELFELDKLHTLHEVAPAIPGPLEGVDVLISAGMCEKLVARLQRNGIVGAQTSCSDPEDAVQQFISEGALVADHAS